MTHLSDCSTTLSNDILVKIFENMNLSFKIVGNLKHKNFEVSLQYVKIKQVTIHN